MLSKANSPALSLRNRCSRARRLDWFPVPLCTLLLLISGCDRPATSVTTQAAPQSSNTTEIGVQEPSVSIDETIAAAETAPTTDSDSGPLQIGDDAPDFQIEALGGQSIRLSDFFGDSKAPTILLFDRANW